MTPLEKLLGRWSARIVVLNKRATRRRYFQAIDRFRAAFPTKEKPSDFQRADIEDYKIWRLKAGQSPWSIRYDLCVLKTFFNWLRAQGLLEVNPIRGAVKLPSKDPRFAARP